MSAINNINILNLPDEILVKIGQFVAADSARTVSKAKSVCQRFNAIFSDSSIKKMIDNSRWKWTDHPTNPCGKIARNGTGEIACVRHFFM